MDPSTFLIIGFHFEKPMAVSIPQKSGPRMMAFASGT